MIATLAQSCLVLALAGAAFSADCRTGWDEIGLFCCRTVITSTQEERCRDMGGVVGGGKCFIGYVKHTAKDPDSICRGHIEYVGRNCSIYLSDIHAAMSCIENFDPGVTCYISEPIDEVVMMLVPGFMGQPGK